MTNAVKQVVIVGGGSAGWLSASILAAEHSNASLPTPIQITLIESSDILTIGVGEGTWPSMRDTLQQIGISETSFLNECDASFKQGSKFINWRTA
ncbi:tryptophan 7-halogenase, partial [Pseudoalteromonas sp.]|uniref:tryptophan 7-halogenase n=1 Tax=Pseudoalteromonas sp. TaxID=53249 RepID=UPI003567B8FA